MIYCVILSVEYRLNSGHLGSLRVQQPGDFLGSDIPPGDDGGSGVMHVVFKWS